MTFTTVENSINKEEKETLQNMYFIGMCSFRKYPYYTHGRYWKFVGSGGLPKSKKFKEMYDVELEFPDGWGPLIKKSLPWEVWIFQETTQ